MKLTIKADDRYAQAFIKQIEKKYRGEERPDDGKVHVYDLLFPRKAFAKAIYGQRITPQAIGFFFLGKAVHSEAQRVMGTEEAEVKAEKYGIIGTMDWKGKDGYEIKSSRKWTVADWPEPQYVKQAGYYSIVHSLPKIIVLTIYPTAGRTWNGKKASTVEAASWVLPFSKPIKKAIEYDMLATKVHLAAAIKSNDPSYLPPVPKWVLEEYPEVDPGEYDRKFDEAHPFYYAYKEKGLL